MPLPVSRTDAHALRAAFVARFGAQPLLFRAPGRINLIGEHTDYSDGFVLPAAIDRQCLVAGAANGRAKLRVFARDLDAEAEIDCGHFFRQGDWRDYVGGVYFTLRAAGLPILSCDLMIASDVPMGAGVSSSAALEVALVRALLAVSGLDAPPRAIAAFAREAERAFVGVPCGPMDQFISVHGRAGHALLLDCRAMQARALPIPARAAFLVVDSGVKHALSDGGYAERRADCEEAAKRLGIPALRDADEAMLMRANLPERLLHRARHVVRENARCQAGAAALEAGDLASFGVLMRQSHQSLAEDFAVTCPETDALAALCWQTPGVLGARQMGGGFGGAVLALVEAQAAQAALAHIGARYLPPNGAAPDSFICTLADGAGPVS